MAPPAAAAVVIALVVGALNALDVVLSDVVVVGVVLAMSSKRRAWRAWSPIELKLFCDYYTYWECEEGPVASATAYIVEGGGVKLY